MPDRFQFSIRLMRVATAIVAVVIWSFVAPRWPWAIARMILAILFASVAIGAVAVTKGQRRIFWIGMSVPLGIAPIAVALVMVQLLMSPYPVPVVLGESDTFHIASRRIIPMLWCFAPINGLFTVFLHWVFSPLANTVRLPRATIIALAISPLLLDAAFFGGMLFGEKRERDRRDPRDQEEVELERKWRLPVEAPGLLPNS